MSVLISVKHTAAHTVSKVLHRYADFRIGATDLEKRCYKLSDSVLLTFDDYGTPEQIESLLHILKDKHVRAMFFVQGDWMETAPELIRDIETAGHILGNHTYSHRVLLGAPTTVIKDEILHSWPGPWLRPPQGRYNKRVRAIAKELGYAICYWTIDSRDWTGASVDSMRHTILTELHPGATILFHMHGAHTIELLPGLIGDIRDRGYKLTDFDEPIWQP